MPTQIQAPPTVKLTEIIHRDGSRVTTKPVVIPTVNVHHFSSRQDGDLTAVHFRDDLGAPYVMVVAESLDEITRLYAEGLRALLADPQTELPAGPGPQAGPDGFRRLRTAEVMRLAVKDRVSVATETGIEDGVVTSPYGGHGYVLVALDGGGQVRHRSDGARYQVHADEKPCYLVVRVEG